MEASKPFYIRRVALSLLAGFFGLAWCALLLADFGCFNALLVWGIAALVVVSVFGGWRRQPEAHAERATGRWDLLAVALAVASLLLTGPPAESILGDWDPGVYVHTAAIIANQGGLLQVEPELNNLSRRELLLISRRRGTVAEPFGGMQIIDGRTSPQFYHLYPAVMAALWPLGGFRAALWLNPLLNVGSLILIYGLSTRLIGRRWGLLATVTLGVQPAQIWMARFSTAEMLTQFLLLSGFVLLGDALKAEKRYSLQGALAGAAFGLAQLARYDTLLVILPLMALLLPAMVLPRYRRPVLSVLSTCVPLLIHVAIHQHYVAPFYRPLQSMVVPVLGAAGCAILLATIFNGTSLGERCRQWVGARGAGLRGLAVLAFVSWCIWAWGLRPAWSYAVATGGWLGRLPGQSLWDGLVGGREAFNMVYLQALFGPFGLALALIGLAGLIRRARGLNVWLWLLPSLIVMVIFVTRVFHDHFMMWVSRRFVPVVVPCLVVGLVAACAQLAAAVRHRRPRFAWMGVAMGLLALTLNGAASASMVRHPACRPGLSGSPPRCLLTHACTAINRGSRHRSVTSTGSTPIKSGPEPNPGSASCFVLCSAGLATNPCICSPCSRRYPSRPNAFAAWPSCPCNP